MMNTIGDSLSKLARSDNLEHGEDEESDDEDTEPGKLGPDYRSSWVPRIISISYRNTLRVFGSRRQSKTNACNQDVEILTTMSVGEI
jgi:hypothetical protein